MKPSLSFRYCLHLALYFAASAGVVSFATTYLLEAGLPAGQVGILMACASFLSCGIQPLLASMADRAKRNLLPAMILALTGTGIVCFGALLLFDLPLYLIAGMFFLGALAFDAMIPLMNSVNVYYTDRGYRINYGLGRGLGALTHAITSLALGYAIRALGASAMPGIVVCLLGVMAATVLGYPRVVPGRVIARESTEAHSGACSVGQFFLRYRWYCLSLLGILFLAMFHIMTENYLIAIMTRLGGDSSSVGTVFFVSTAAVPVMICFDRIRQRISPTWLLRIAGLSFCLKAVLLLLARSVTAVYFIQLLQMTTYALLSPAQLYYARERVCDRDMVKGQAFSTAAYALGCALGNLTGGQLVEHRGVMSLLTTGVFVAAAGTIILFLTTGRTDRRAPLEPNQGCQ